ncbi:MAG TPA: hypothetical protein VF972_06745 [Actinomycetota bacterium]
MRQAPVVDPRLIDHLGRAGFFPTQVRIEKRVDARTSTGAPDRTWQPVAGLESVQAARGQVPTPDPEVRGVQTEGEVETLIARFALRGHYPSITPAMRVVQVDTQETFEVVGVAHRAGVMTVLDGKITDPFGVL